MPASVWLMAARRKTWAKYGTADDPRQPRRPPVQRSGSSLRPAPRSTMTGIIGHIRPKGGRWRPLVSASTLRALASAGRK